MKQKAMAKIIGVSPSLISDIKRGRKSISRKMALRLHDVSGVGLDLLLKLPAEDVFAVVRDALNQRGGDSNE